MSNTIKKLKSFLTANQPTLTEQDIVLWVELYTLTRQQQQFALAVLPLLKTQDSELEEQCRQIIALDTLLRKTKGKLLNHINLISDSSLKQTLLDLTHQ